MTKKPEYIEYEDGTRILLDEDDAPELTAEWFSKAMRFEDLPKELREGLLAMTQRGRPRKADKKVSLHLRVDPDVAAAFRATGKGWQTRINALLRAAMPAT